HIYFLQGKFAQAEKEYRQSIAVMVNLPEGNLSINSFSPEALSHSTQLTKGFSLIGKSQWYQYKNHQDRSMLYEAFHSLQLATELIPSVYRQFQTEESRLFMAEQSIPTFEYAIKASLELHKLTGQDSFLHHAFGFAEQNKAALLYQSLKDSEYRQSIGIPDSVLEKEQEIKTELTFYRRKVYQEEQKGNDKNTQKITYWRNKIFELEEAERSINIELQNQYPGYFWLKYQKASLSPDSIQSLLGSGKAMIEYFRGDSSTYAFVITDKDVRAVEIPNHDSLGVWVNEMRQGLYRYWMDQEKPSELYAQANQQYTTYAHRLYQSLIEPIKHAVSNLPEELLIIPDGVLGYIPFDALLENLPEKPEQFGSHDYLLRNYRMSYAYSAALWARLQQQPSQTVQSDMLAIGPVFPKSDDLFATLEDRRRDGFGPLLFNRQEVDQISSLFGGTLLTEQAATKDAFLAHASNYRFIHLSTHAKANDQDSRYSCIAFTPVQDTTQDNDFLTLSEICNLHLNAEMIVLSACETALGELKRGEGIMSLSRAFTYAGARSVITTLWSVDDEATADLMSRFYGYLTEGERKDEALRQARLDYIDEHDNRFSHPFFWAAAVPMGNMEAIEIEKSWGWEYWIFAMIFLSGGFVVWRKTRNF
ncbi:MAG: CHAT domain-containing protein, partial [Bacteroidetes bacterium]|nr:CHAT domain-containing protein [Bacteroidota bacterium]